MIKKLSAFLLVLLPILVMANEADLSWSAPLQNEDGSFIADTCITDPNTCLAGYNIYYGTATGTYTLGPINIPNPTIVTYTVTGLQNNTTYYFVATAYNAGGQESAFSGEASKIIPPIRPGPPTGLTVSPDNNTAYTYSISDNVLVMIPIGTVLSTTPCDSTMSMNGLYRVDIDLVNYIGSIQPPLVFAECI